MSGHRFEIDISAGPSREGLLHGRAQLLVRVRLSDGPGCACTQTGHPAREPDVWTDLRPDCARRVAFELLACAEHAERQTRAAGWWQR
jgi:hypothetical protein